MGLLRIMEACPRIWEGMGTIRQPNMNGRCRAIQRRHLPPMTTVTGIVLLSPLPRSQNLIILILSSFRKFLLLMITTATRASSVSCFTFNATVFVLRVRPYRALLSVINLSPRCALLHRGVSITPAAVSLRNRTKPPGASSYQNIA